MHFHFGYLGRTDSFAMPRLSALHGGCETRPSQIVNLSATGLSNARCAGCMDNMIVGEARDVTP
jgi:hypothetical protein